MSFSHKTYLMIGSHEETDFLSLSKAGYELENCKFTLYQGIDQRGKASTEVHGGTLSVILSRLPSDEIIDWSLNSRRYHKGVIVTFNEDNTPLERIFFENAACTDMGVSYKLSGKSYTTTHIEIHAERLIFGNGLDFDNNWTK